MLWRLKRKNSELSAFTINNEVAYTIIEEDNINYMMIITILSEQKRIHLMKSGLD